MDLESRSGGFERGLKEAARLKRRLREGHRGFDEFENRFLELLGTNMDTAELQVFALKRIQGLPVDLLARKQRLIGRFYEAKSQHKASIAWTKRALRNFRGLADRDGLNQCLRTLFSSYIHLGRYQTARDIADELLRDPDVADVDKLKVYVNLGALENRNHNYALAGKYLESALDLVERLDEQRYRGIVSHNYANCLVCLNKFGEAEHHYQIAKAAFQRSKMPLYEAYVLQALSYLYVILGQFFHAEQNLDAAKKQYLSVGDEFGAALCDLDGFRMEARLNRYERVLDSAESLAERFSVLGRHFEEGLVHYHAAHVAVGTEEFEFAEDSLDHAQAIFKKERNEHYLALCRVMRGLILWRRGDVKRSLLHMDKAKDIFVATGLKEMELLCLIYRFRIGNRIPDKKAFKRLRYLMNFPIGRQVRTQALILESNYWYELRQIKRACSALFEAVTHIEESRASIISDKMREAFFDDKTEVYELLIARLLEWRDPSASKVIFKVIELSRSRQMAELMSRKEMLPPVLNKDEPRLLELNRLDMRLKQLERRLESLTEEVAAVAPERSHLMDEISKTRKARAEIQIKMRREERLGFYFPIDLGLDELRGLLQEGHLLVVYFLSQNTLFRLELDHQGLSTYRESLSADFERDLNLLRTLVAHPMDARHDKVLELADRLSAVLAPKRLSGNNHCIFVFHKLLHGFPAALMRVSGRYLLETHTMSQSPNLPCLYFCLKREDQRFEKPTFFFSNREDDPAAAERGILKELFPRAKVLDSLSIENPAEVFAQSDFIHFAGHSHFERKTPEMSYLQLAGEKVYLKDFAKFQLANPFINLASCRSGSMVLGSGNEPYGFVVTLFAAGAGRLLGSHWEIDDLETAGWMSTFYRHLALGLPEAYRRAGLEIMKNKPYPYYWAGFTLLGKP